MQQTQTQQQQQHTYFSSPQAVSGKTKTKFRANAEGGGSPASIIDASYNGDDNKENYHSNSYSNNNNNNATATSSLSKLPMKADPRVSNKKGSNYQPPHPPSHNQNSSLRTRNNRQYDHVINNNNSQSGIYEPLTHRAIEEDIDESALKKKNVVELPAYIATLQRSIQTQTSAEELFDFALEVEPLLDVLVGKTISIAKIELKDEVELEDMRRRTEEFEIIRLMELAELQRLEAEIKRFAKEKSTRAAQAEHTSELRRMKEESVTARAIAFEATRLLRSDVTDVLISSGAYIDPLSLEIKEKFLPDLMFSVKSGFSQYLIATRMADELITEAREKSIVFEEHSCGLRQAKREAEEKRLREEAEAREAERLMKLEEEAKALAALEAGEGGEEGGGGGDSSAPVDE